MVMVPLRVVGGAIRRRASKDEPAHGWVSLTTAGRGSAASPSWASRASVRDSVGPCGELAQHRPRYWQRRRGESERRDRLLVILGVQAVPHTGVAEPEIGSADRLGRRPSAVLADGLYQEAGTRRQHDAVGCGARPRSDQGYRAKLRRTPEVSRRNVIARVPPVASAGRVHCAHVNGASAASTMVTGSLG